METGVLSNMLDLSTVVSALHNRAKLEVPLTQLTDKMDLSQQHFPARSPLPLEDLLGRVPVCGLPAPRHLEIEFIYRCLCWPTLDWVPW